MVEPGLTQACAEHAQTCRAVADEQHVVDGPNTGALLPRRGACDAAQPKTTSSRAARRLLVPGRAGEVVPLRG